MEHPTYKATTSATSTRNQKGVRPNSESQTLTVKDLAERWSVSAHTIRRYARQRRLAVIQLGRGYSVRIPLTEVERWEQEAR